MIKLKKRITIKKSKLNKIKQPKRQAKRIDTNIRFNILSTIVYALGIIILVRLFSLQIVNGATYRETSNTRISRETTIEATRGNILDRNGTVLVSSEMTFSLEMYKSKSDDESLNSSISLMTQILNANGDTYVDNFSEYLRKLFNSYALLNQDERERIIFKSEIEIILYRP